MTELVNILTCVLSTQVKAPDFEMYLYEKNLMVVYNYDTHFKIKGSKFFLFGPIKFGHIFNLNPFK